MPLPPTLLALTPGRLSQGDRAGLERLVASVDAAVRAGLRGVLVREPALADGDFLELAERLRTILSSPGAWLGLHDRPHLATSVGAEGVHLGYRSLPPGAARRVCGSGVALGLSTHMGDDPQGFLGVDYRFFGPLRETPSKRGILEPTGFEELARQTCAPPPLWALGGLEPADGPRVLECGARGLAVLGGILGSGDPARGTRAYLEALA